MSKKLTEDEAKKRVLEKCKKLSTENEIITFLGWKGNIYMNNSTHLILHNSKFNLTWDTTSYSNFILLNIKYPSLSNINNKDIKKEIRKETIKYTTNDIIDKIKELYPTKNWDFSKTSYTNYHTKICIICHEKDPITGKEHGEFWATPANLFSSKPGERCPKCSGKYNYTTEEYIEKAKIIHNSFYTYEKTNYVNNKTKIIVTCPIHGDFEIISGSHLMGEGCKNCANEYKRSIMIKSNLEELEKEINLLYPEMYDFSESTYMGLTSSIKIKCKLHNRIFYQRPDLILRGIRSCPECQQGKPLGELATMRYLDNKEINYKYQYKLTSKNLIDCPNKDYVEIDYYLEHNGRKIFIEFNGQQHYRFVYLFHKDISNFHRQLLRDLSVVNYARGNGIELLEIPYCDLSRVPEILDAFLERSENITTYIPRDLLSGPSLPLGLPLLD